MQALEKNRRAILAKSEYLGLSWKGKSGQMLSLRVAARVGDDSNDFQYIAAEGARCASVTNMRNGNSFHVEANCVERGQVPSRHYSWSLNLALLQTLFQHRFDR